MRPAEPARFEAEWKKTLDELIITPHDYSRPRFLLGLIAGAAAAGGAAYALHHYLG
jgi:hypothetical protein